MGAFRGVKKSVQALLDRVGYTIRRTEQVRPVDVRDRGGDPRFFDYYGGSRSVLIEASLARGRGLCWFGLTPDSAHPWIRAVRRARGSRRPRSVIREVLEDYYHQVRPASAARWLGFGPGEVPALDDQPPWARVLPWESADIEGRRQTAEMVAAAEGRQQGWQLSIEDGWNSYGPVSRRLVAMETERLLTLMRSIGRAGYRRTDRPGGDIDVSVLWGDERSWHFEVTGGAHRAAVVAALGYERIPVRITRLVRRSDAEIWPNVASGLYPTDRALELFDRIVANRQPRLLGDWR